MVIFNWYICSISSSSLDRSIVCLVKVLSNDFSTELTYKEQFPLFLRDCNYRNCVKGRQVKEQTEAQRAEKMFFWDRVLPSYQVLDDRPHLIWMSASATADSKVNIFLVDTFGVFDKLLHFMD